MARPRNQLRIIGGALRGRRLVFSDAKGLRPTADRLRETLFNWLQRDVAGSVCLDLFAGSGALGVEALSRGAGQVVFVERSRTVAETLRENLVTFGIADRARVIHADARTLFGDRQRSVIGPFDIVFLDPPFATGLMADAVTGLDRCGLIVDSGWIYQEQDAAVPWEALPPGWRQRRAARAGQANGRLLQVGSS